MIKKAKALEINIGLLPLEFELTSNADDPDPDGKFTLSWSESEYATKYVVYQGDVKIAEDITTLKYQITDLETGEYTFSVKAINEYGEAESNTITVEVKLEESAGQEPDNIPGYEISILIAMHITISGIIFIIVRKRVFARN